MDDNAREQADRHEDTGALSRQVWTEAESTLKPGNTGKRSSDADLVSLDFDGDIYAGSKNPQPADTRTATNAKNGPDAGTEHPDGGTASGTVDVEIGQAVIEPGPHVEVEIGEAVIEREPRIEIEIGEAVVEREPRIEIEIGEAVVEREPRIEIEIGEAVVERTSSSRAVEDEPRSFEFRPDGSSSYEIRRGDTLREISRDVLQARHPDDPDYRPTGRELDRTVQELARHNHIEDPDVIRTGRTLEIPSQVPSNVRVNENGRVTDITYPNGNTAHVEYGSDQRVSEVRSTDGTWRREADGWNLYDAGNNRTQHLEGGEVIVRTDGAIEAFDSSGEGQVRFPNGGYMEANADGSGVWRNAAGRPEQVDYPNGRPSTSIHNDAAGNPDRVSVGGPGGQEWRREADGWHQYSNGRRQDGAPDQMEVSTDGTITLRSADGDMVRWHPDGESTTVFAGVTTDHGRVTAIQRPNGNSDQLTYDAQGNLTEVRNSDNSYWRLDSDGWNQYDSNNARVRHLDGGSVRVNEQDGIEFFDRNGAGEVRWPNGGSYEQNAEGSGIWRDAGGHPEQIDYPNGRPSTTIHHDAAGNPDRLAVGGPGGQEWRRESDGWHQYDNGTRRSGAPDQVALSADGTVTLRTADGDTIVWHPNGDTTTTFDNVTAAN